jgi:hypothetical protein
MEKIKTIAKGISPFFMNFIMMAFSTWVFIKQLNIHAYDWRFYASLISMIGFNTLGIIAIYYFIKNYKSSQ